MEFSYVPEVDSLISDLEATYVGDSVLSTGDGPNFTDTCFTCKCETR